MTDECLDTALLHAGTAALRVDVYALLAALLARPPHAGRLSQLEHLDLLPDIPHSLASPVEDLKEAAARSDADAVAREYDALFVGLGRGEVMPYASWYAEQILMSAPLARLRKDLAGLGVERREGTCEPEDHAAVLCEIMVLLVVEPQVPPKRQAAFFRDHLAPWMGRFFHDLQASEAADFYRAVGRLGETYMRLEEDLLQAPTREEE